MPNTQDPIKLARGALDPPIKGSTAKSKASDRAQSSVRNFLRGQYMLAFVPLSALLAFWIVGEIGLILTSVAIPILIFVSGAGPGKSVVTPPVDALTGLALRQDLVTALDRMLSERKTSRLSTACLVVDVDQFKDIVDRYGHSTSERVIKTVAERLTETLRDADVMTRLDGASFAVMLTPERSVDLESVIQIASRIQAAVGDPIPVNGQTIYVNSSIGFCLTSRTPEGDGAKMLFAAESAMIEARRHGPGAIRSYSKEMKRRLAAHATLVEDARIALELGQISAWYQPQVSTETGQITGFEALARWSHPDRGLIPPGEFLPALEQSGMQSRLGEVMMYHALTALRNWDKAGVSVPSVAINFSEHELRDPRLMEKIKWELDRFDLTPDRLTIEIMENVVAETDDDLIPKNIAMLSEIGCRIDLDDFGTGHASIAAIRRFAVNRIKIDRSFVARIDEDAEQQRLLSAILMMAERLELEAIAEGVESLGERSVLAQPGCEHVQGYGIARPMPFDDTLIWIAGHVEKLKAAPSVFGGKTGSRPA